MAEKLRELHFDNIHALEADVGTLRARGYQQGGQWNLPMIEDHLAKAIAAPLDGAGPKLFWPLNAAARFMIRRMARRDRYPAFKFPAPSFMSPDKSVTAAAADAAFDAATARVKSIDAPTITTRAFGTVATADWRAMQLLHAAHHLGFLNPK